MCNRDCFNCLEHDCTNDELTYDEIISQNVRDRFAMYERKYGSKRVAADYERSDRGKERQRKYEATEKAKERRKKYSQSKEGKAAKRRYNSSEKGKASQKRYLKSEKGQAMLKKKRQKDISSGKNAEACLKYYQRKKEKMLRELLERSSNEADI